jgi:hypothetical protein
MKIYSDHESFRLRSNYGKFNPTDTSRVIDQACLTTCSLAHVIILKFVLTYVVVVVVLKLKVYNEYNDCF